MGWRRALLLALRVVFFAVLVYAIVNYVLAARQAQWPWRVRPVDPFSREPPVTVQIEVREEELVLRVYRSYTDPLARRVQLNVTVCSDECLLYLFAERMSPSSVREFSVYVAGKKVCGVYVSVLLEGRLVEFRQFASSC